MSRSESLATHTDESAEKREYEMLVGGSPSTMRHGCNISGDLCERINCTITPMAIIGDTNIFEVSDILRATKEGGALHGLVTSEEMIVLNALTEDLLEI